MSQEVGEASAVQFARLVNVQMRRIRVTTRMGQVLARENARVVVTDLNLDSCQETQASLRFSLKAYKVLSTRMVDFLKIVTYVSLLE